MESEIRLLCSTGTMVGSCNGYNLSRALNVISELVCDGVIFGGELMMLGDYYRRRDEVIKSVSSSGIPFPVIHCDKDVGSLLSRSASLRAAGQLSAANEMRDNAHDMFRLNCDFGEAIGARATVLHLWGGTDSDSNIFTNIENLSFFSSESSKHSLRLLIENVPSTTYSPLSNWHRILKEYPDASLIYDTRFAALHDEWYQTLTDEEIYPHIKHIHVSDFRGAVRDFSALRPIFHPGEGIVDFAESAKLLAENNYRGFITLESPVMNNEDLDTAKLRRSLIKVSSVFNISSI